MSRRPYVLTKGAAADLRDISRYTAETWGEAQRRAYVQQLHDAVIDVAEGRGMFKDWGAVLPGLRVKAVGSHYVFCLSRPGHPALILAILHERMDLIARLKRRLDDRGDYQNLAARVLRNADALPVGWSDLRPEGTLRFGWAAGVGHLSYSLFSRRRCT